MKEISNKIKICSGLILATIASVGLNLGLANQALAVNDINLNVPIQRVDTLSTTETFDIEVPEYSQGAELYWGASGTTEVITNATKADSLNYIPKVGDIYRITNIGKTQITNTVLDIIVEVTSVEGVGGVSFAGGQSYPPQLRFFDGAGGGYKAISVYYGGISKIGLKFRVVQRGTETPITITNAAYFSDIDYNQGVVESYSNQLRIYRNETMINNHLVVNPANNAVYDMNSIYPADANGRNTPTSMITPDFGTYIGAGTFSEFELDYYNQYPAVEINKTHTFANTTTRGLQFDILGKYSNIKLVQKQPTISTTYKFQSENGEEISPDIIKKQNVLDADPSTKKVIDGYEFVTLKQGENNTWIWVYKKTGPTQAQVKVEKIAAPNTGIEKQNFGAEIKLIAFGVLVIIGSWFVARKTIYEK